MFIAFYHDLLWRPLNLSMSGGTSSLWGPRGIIDMRCVLNLFPAWRSFKKTRGFTRWMCYAHDALLGCFTSPWYQWGRILIVRLFFAAISKSSAWSSCTRDLDGFMTWYGWQLTHEFIAWVYDYKDPIITQQIAGDHFRQCQQRYFIELQKTEETWLQPPLALSQHRGLKTDQTPFPQTEFGISVSAMLRSCCNWLFFLVKLVLFLWLSLNLGSPWNGMATWRIRLRAIYQSRHSYSVVQGKDYSMIQYV